MSPRAPRGNIDAFDRQLALSVTGLILGLMVVVSVIAAFTMNAQREDERARLLEIIDDTVSVAIKGVSFSGRYRLRQLVTGLAKRNDAIAYVSVSDGQGNVLAHSDPAHYDQISGAEDQVPDAMGRSEATRALATGQAGWLDRHGPYGHVTELHIPVSSGYRGQHQTLVRVGVSTDDLDDVLVANLLSILAIFGGLVVVTLLTVSRLSRRLGRPVKRLAAAVAGTAEAIGIADVEGHVVYTNPSLANLLRHTAGDLHGKNLAQVATSNLTISSDGLTALRDAITRRLSWQGSAAIPAPQGAHEAQLWSLRLSVVFDRERPDRVVGYVFMGRDISREAALEEQLAHSQKMEAIGRLAGGIAHDFNNLLTIINGHAEILLMDSDELADEAVENVEAIRDAGLRAAQLTGQLLAYSRRQVLQLRPLDLGDVATELRPMLRRVLGAEVSVDVRVEGPVRRVLADRGRFEQILVNLAVNARDAMPGGGEVVITVSNCAPPVASRDTDPDLSSAVDGGVCVTVTDTGGGIPSAVIDRIFEPFFTTKDVGQGTGLGLAMVHGIVTQSGGSITVHSVVNVGTTFTLRFPEASATASGPHPTPARGTGATTGLAGREILVVEDDAPVASVLRQLLRHAGCAVHLANSGEAALDLLDGGLLPDAVLCDVMLPGMRGPEIITALRTRLPELPAVFISGFAGSQDAVPVHLRDVRVIDKPPTQRQLLGALADVIPRGPPPAGS